MKGNKLGTLDDVVNLARVAKLWLNFKGQLSLGGEHHRIAHWYLIAGSIVIAAVTLAATLFVLLQNW